MRFDCGAQPTDHHSGGDLLGAAWGSRRASIKMLIGVQWVPSFPHPIPPMEDLAAG